MGQTAILQISAFQVAKIRGESPGAQRFYFLIFHHTCWRRIKLSLYSVLDGSLFIGWWGQEMEEGDQDLSVSYPRFPLSMTMGL
jgi:hypothetical protein